MLYEIEEENRDLVMVNTRALDYDAIWFALRLGEKEADAADRIINLYHLAEESFNGDLLNRRSAHQYQEWAIALYKTRAELWRAAKNNQLVRRLIKHEVLEFHKCWRSPKLRGHVQTPYRLNANKLYELQRKAEAELEEEFDED